ncbi:hypothetical protein BH10PSE12_BH10PSE12_02550 [soil metagenome]
MKRVAIVLLKIAVAPFVLAIGGLALILYLTLVDRMNPVDPLWRQEDNL